MVEHNCVTGFSSYSYTYEWKISNISHRLNKTEPLECPETIKSPPGNLPATEWRLAALGDSEKANCYNSTEKPNSWTVKLTLVSQNEVWVCIRLQTKVRNCYNHSIYGRDLLLSPTCADTSRRIKVSPQDSITGFIRFAANSGDTIDRDYLYDGQDLILYFMFTVTQLDTPFHTICAAPVEKASHQDLIFHKYWMMLVRKNSTLM